MKEKSQNKKHHYVYKLTHRETGEYYVGSRSISKNPVDDDYLGSMINWKISKEDKIKFLDKEILKSDFSSREEAIEYESMIISRNLELNSNLFKNKHIPNKGFHTVGCVSVIDKNGKHISVPLDDPKFLNGEYLAERKGKSTVIDSFGNFMSVSKDDIRISTGELKHLRKDKVTVKDKNGINHLVDSKDPRYLSGELKHNMSNLVSVKDSEGNNFIVDSKDPRYLSRELVGICKGTITVKDKEGNKFRISKEDPRYLRGELVGVSSGLIAYNVRLRINNRVQSARNWSIEFGIENKKLREYLEINEIEFIKLHRYEKC
jgi:hypothetical protein